MPFDEELKIVASLYELDPDPLKAQLAIFRAGARDVKHAHELVKFLQANSRTIHSLPQVMDLAKCLLVMPATNAVSERSFSALKLIKTYLRSTQTQERLNHVMTLFVHKNLTDRLNLVDIANEFVSRCEIRLRIFGRFSLADIKPKGSSASLGTQT